MSALRYKFSKEAEPNLLRFLKAAKKQQSSKYCDLKQYEMWRKLLPEDTDIMQNLDEFEVIEAPVIDLCSDDTSDLYTETEEITKIHDETITVSDLAFAIKEKLQMQDLGSDVMKEHLLKCPEIEIAALFKILEESLTSEEIYQFGTVFQNVSYVINSAICHHLLIPRIRKGFCEKLFNLLDEFSKKHSSLLTVECSGVLQELRDEEIPIILQYLKRLNSQFLSVLIRNFILAIDRVDENSLLIVGTLLHNDIEYEALSKFINMVSNIADTHSRDKNFGKLLVTIVEALGPNLIHVEQPLKLIIAGHKSVWKSKLEKSFTCCYEDSMMFSQSFQD